MSLQDLPIVSELRAWIARNPHTLDATVVYLVRDFEHAYGYAPPSADIVITTKDLLRDAIIQFATPTKLVKDLISIATAHRADVSSFNSGVITITYQTSTAGTLHGKH